MPCVLSKHVTSWESAPSSYILKPTAIPCLSAWPTKPVRLADEAYCIGQAQAKKSYLDIARIIETAKAAKADAIHPGYGFLSENADFADACANYHFTYIGASGEHLHRSQR